MALIDLIVHWQEAPLPPLRLRHVRRLFRPRPVRPGEEAGQPLRRHTRLRLRASAAAQGLQETGALVEFQSVCCLFCIFSPFLYV